MLGKLLGKLFGGGGGSVEGELKALLVTALATAAPRVGDELQIGSKRVQLLQERWRIRLLAQREE